MFSRCSFSAVDGDPLDQRGRVAEDLEHPSAGLGVGRHARRHDDGVGAQLQGLASAHRRLHPAALRLIAGRHHHAAADDDRPPTQPGSVALLDGGEERVEVGVQHRRLAAHPRLLTDAGSLHAPATAERGTVPRHPESTPCRRPGALMI
jgi:hypothetical protein